MLNRIGLISSLVILLASVVGCDPEPLNPRGIPSVASDLGQDMTNDLSSDLGLGDMPKDTTSDMVGDMATDMVADQTDQSPDMMMDMVKDMPPASNSAGCVSGQGMMDGEHTFMLEGKSRRFIVRLPKNYSKDKAWSLVLALHGNGGNTSYWDKTSGDRNIRQVLENDAVLIVAEAIDNQWRDYNAPRETWPARIESELSYFDYAINEAKTNLCINTDKLFAMGFSGGGSFSGLLGCRRSDIRAFAAGGAVIYFDETKCVNTPAAWITIGKKELEGREPFRNFFRDRAMCKSTSQSAQPSPCVAYDECGATTPVHYCEHPDGHIWPAFGSQAMWDFFKQF